MPIVYSRDWDNKHVLTEGIPFAFKDAPGLYEVMRDWISTKLKNKGLNINVKEISLTGSGRIGQSLAPKKLGQTFTEQVYDLDIFVISGLMFEEVKNEFNTWRDDYKTCKEVPSKEEKPFWDENLIICGKNIDKWFIDLNKIPNRYKYTKSVNNIMWQLKEKLSKTDGAPKIKKSTIRCYRTWDDCINQISRSLEH